MCACVCVQEKIELQERMLEKQENYNVLYEDHERLKGEYHKQEELHQRERRSLGQVHTHLYVVNLVLHPATISVTSMGALLAGHSPPCSKPLSSWQQSTLPLCSLGQIHTHLCVVNLVLHPAGNDQHDLHGGTASLSWAKQPDFPASGSICQTRLNKQKS